MFPEIEIEKIFPAHTLEGGNVIIAVGMKPEVTFLLENANWPALLVDAASTILRANQAAVKLFGLTLEGASPLLSAIWAPENGINAELFLAQWERSPTPAMPLKFRIKGGGVATYATSICSSTSATQKLFIIQLLSEPPGSETKAQSADAHAHKQKLDCALQLARSVALDFNNALTSILGYTSLLLSKAEANHPWRKALLEVEKSAAKAAEIANDLAAFSRQEKQASGQPADNLNVVLQRCVEIFQNSRREPVAWKLQWERRLFAAKFDEAKIQQAFMKILENAVESLVTDGRVAIHTRNVELAEATQDRNTKLAAGNYVCAEISDNGRGLEPDVLPRIFEPFFTTKMAPHRGLGLALVYGIVTNHAGGVAVSSQPGTGTSVRVYLPAEKNVVKNNTEFTDKLTGDQTILMVDDEDLLLTMGEMILSEYGYRVSTANSGQKALEIISKAGKPFDLLITDLVMPVMSGRELVDHVRQVSPETHIMCTSGYVWPAHQEEYTAYLQKPFTTQELLLKVKQVLAPAPTVVD
jgi:two-component system cell cycle sensor histidine kinase/response regulator CckA